MTSAEKVFLTGLAIAGAGVAVLATMGTWPPTSQSLSSQPILIEPLLLGAGLAIAGACAAVLRPALKPELARRVPLGSVPTSLAMLVVVAVVSNLASLPLLAFHSQSGAASLIYGIAVSELPLLLVLWLRVVHPGCLTWRGLGLISRPLGRRVLTGVEGGIALFVLAALTGALLTRAGIHQTQAERFAGIQHASPGFFGLALIAGCVLAPFCEELFFRGYLFQTFRNRWGAAPAYLYSAGLFALVHFNLPALAPIFVLGLVLAYIFETTGSAVPGMIAHGINNLISFSLLYFAGLRG